MHLDIKTAFLNGNLVCKLNKAIYGLKQAAKVWNDTINNFLVEYGLKRNAYEPCMYTMFVDSKMLFILMLKPSKILRTTGVPRLPF